MKITLPCENLPPVLEIPGEFSGYYSFSILRYEHIADTNFYSEGYRYGPEKDAPSWDSFISNEDFKFPDAPLWSRIYGVKPKERDFLPILYMTIPLFRQDAMDFILKSGEIAPHIRIEPCRFSFRNKEVIPPQPYLLLLSDWLIPYDIRANLPPPISSQIMINPNYTIYYIPDFFKGHISNYDLLPGNASSLIFSEKLAKRMLEFDNRFQFDPVYYPPKGYVRPRNA